MLELLDTSSIKMDRTCIKCKIEKTLDCFSNDKKSKLGKRSQCKDCQLKYYREYRAKHKSYGGIRQIVYRKKIKDTVFNHYGWRCNCCHENEPKFLTIDHTNGGGAEHRKTIKTSTIYQWLIRNGFPDEFQTLCYNCNCGKARNNGICPHHKG